MPKRKGAIAKNVLVELYVNQKLSGKEIGKRLGRDTKGIFYWMQKYGIKSRPCSVPGQHRKYVRNDAFFQAWSSEMAWVLGLMFADGNVSPNGNGWVCTLTSIDQSLLKKAALLLGTNSPIRKQKNRNAFRLTVGNTLIGRDLIAFGCIPAKSLVKQFPIIPDALLSHFVRGLWDGNGCIRGFNRQQVNSNPRVVTAVYSSGSAAFAISLRDMIFQHTGVNANVGEYERHQYKIPYWQDKARKVLSWIYQDSTPQTRLERKFSIASEFL